MKSAPRPQRPTEPPPWRENPPLAPPPVMTWEDVEEGRRGQLEFPALATLPSMAERTFLVLAREWQAEALSKAGGCHYSRQAERLQLACLLLVVEHGKAGNGFTRVACDQINANNQTAIDRRAKRWHDGWSWGLCWSALARTPAKTFAVETLISSLDHPNSSIRDWMLELGWMVAPLLSRDQALVPLLTNFADKLGGVWESMGLAARFFQSTEDLERFAKEFKPPEDYKDQYEERMKELHTVGIGRMQVHFWRTEAICRSEIARAIMGLDLRKNVFLPTPWYPQRQDSWDLERRPTT